MSTSTSPIRGKFLNNSQPSIRGKVLQNEAKKSPEKSEPRKILRATPYHEASLKLFQDLDQAEELVLNLLQVASSTAAALGNMTNTSDGEDQNESKEKIVEEKIEANGKEYLQTIGKVHALLAPYAKKVLPYSRQKADEEIKGDGSVEGGKKDEKGALHDDKKISDKTSGEILKAAEKEKDVSSGTNVAKTKASCTTMYAARIERSLAIERLKVLKSFSRIMSKEQKQNSDMGENEKLIFDDKVGAGSKRKLIMK